MLKKISTLLNKIQEKIFKEKRFIYEDSPESKTTEETIGSKESAQEAAQRHIDAKKQALESDTGLGLLSEEEERISTELNDKIAQLQSKNLDNKEKQELFNEILSKTDYAAIANPRTIKNLLDFYNSAESKEEKFTKLLSFIEKGNFKDNLSLTLIYCKSKKLGKEINTIFDAIRNNAINSNMIKFINSKALNILLKGRNTKDLSLEIQTYLLNSNLNKTDKEKLFKKLVKETQNLNENALKELQIYSQKDDETFNIFIENLDPEGRTTLLGTAFETTGAAGQEFKLTKTKIEFTTEAPNPKDTKKTLTSNRSFMRRPKIENTILKAKTPSEVIKACYSHLLEIIEEKDYSKQVKNYEASNEFMEKRITEIDEKNKTIIETTPAQTEVTTEATKDEDGDDAGAERAETEASNTETEVKTIITSEEIPEGNIKETHKLSPIKGLPGAPSLYLTRNPNGSTTLSYERFFIGDKFIKIFEAGTTTRTIKDEIKRQEEEIRAEISDFSTYTNINRNTGEILDTKDKVDIFSSEISDFTKAEFLENFDNIKGSELMAGELATKHGIQREEAPAIIADFIKDGRTSLDIALWATKDLEGGWTEMDEEGGLASAVPGDNYRSANLARVFKENWDALKKAEKTRDNEKTKKLKADLRKTYNSYLSAKKVMETISTASYSEKETEAAKETHAYSAKKAERITNEETPIYGQYFNLPGGKMEGFKFGITEKANTEFRDAYAESMELDNADQEWIQGENIVDKVLLAYNYNLDELISLGAIKQGDEGLVLVTIPSAITTNAKNPNLKPLFERVNEESIGLEKSWNELDQPNQKESERLRAKEIQRALETRDSYENSLIEAFKKYSKENTEDTTEWASWTIDAQSKSIDPTLRDMDKKYYEILGNVFGREITDEVAAIQILDQPEVEINDESGRRTIKLYTIDRFGAKTYNKENLDLYIAHLIKLGQKQKEFENTKRDRNYNPETVLEEDDGTIKAELEKQGIEDTNKFEEDFNKGRDEYFRLARIKNPSKEEKRRIPGAKYNYDIYKGYIDNAVAATNKAKRANEAKPDISTNPDIHNLKSDEVELLKKGYLFQRNSGEIKEELASNPKVRKIQTQLVKAGYPESEIGNVESNLLAAGAFSMEGEKITGVGLAFPVIDVGNGYKVAPVVSTEGVDLGLGFDVYKSEKDSAKAIMAAGIGPLGPRVSVGYIQNINIDEAIKGVDFQWAFGVSLSAAPGASLTIGLAYNEEEQTLEVFERQRTHEGMEAIDRTEDLNTKVALLKKHKNFKEIATHLDDAQLLYVYETWKSIDAENADKEAEAPVIKGIQAGVMMSPAGFGFVAAITFEIGEVKLVQPSIRTKEKIAAQSVDNEITDKIYWKIAEHAKNMTESEIDSQFYTYDSPKIYMTSEGQVGILSKGSEKEIEITEDSVSNLELIKEELHKVELDADISTITIDGEEKQVLELSILNIKNKDVEVLIDPDTARDLNIILTNDKRILIPGSSAENLRGLIIASTEFNYRYQKTEGNAATMKTIVITNEKNYIDRRFNLNEVRKESRNMLVKKWENGNHSTWEIADGEKTGGIERFNPESRYENNTLSWNFENFKETVDTSNIELKELNDIFNDTREMKENFHPMTEEDLRAQGSRFESINQARGLYKEIEQQLKNGPTEGGISIADTKAIIEAANSKLDSPLNDKEAGEFLTLVNHEYFASIWESEKEEGIKNLFDLHNQWISENVLIPEYMAAGVTKERAEAMAKKVTENAKESFTSVIEGIENIDDIRTNPIARDTIFASGTNVRETGEAVLTSMLHTMEFEGVPKMGIIGNAKEWDINSKDPVERDIARITIKMLNKNPDKTNLETFYQPITIKLAAFEGTRIALGKESYAELTEFYGLSRAEQGNSLDKYSETLNEFTEFYNEAMNAITENKGIINLGDDRIIRITTKASTGAYGKCGNLSSMLDIDFSLMTKVPQEEEATFIAVGAERDVGVKLEKTTENIDLVLGASWRPGEDDIPRERDGKKASKGPGEDVPGEAKSSGDGPAKVQTKSDSHITNSGKGSTAISPSKH